MWRLYGELLVLLAASFVIGCALGSLAARRLTRGAPEGQAGEPDTAPSAAEALR